jgi:hypothetical protein
MQTFKSLGKGFRRALTMRREDMTARAKAVPDALSSLGLKSRIGIGHFANVLDYGADPTGATSSSAAFKRAWEAAPLLYAPAGKYLLTSTLVGPNKNNAGIIGDGAAYGITAAGDNYTSGSGTLLVATFDTGNVIESHAKILHPTFIGFAICRTKRGSSGYGLEMNPSSTQDQCLLYDLHFMNHHIGAHLGSTGWSVLNTSCRKTAARMALNSLGSGS